MSSTTVSTEEALQYEKESLENEIEKINANIALFEDTIKQERERIDRYRQMIMILDMHNKK